MDELETFKKGVQDFLAKNLPKHLRFGNSPDLPQNDLKKWFDALAERGWITPDWPTEYGGGGLDRKYTAALRAEFRAVDAPMPSQTGITLLGPTLLDVGTEEQRQEHLPKIANNSMQWCQGFSEPGAGSDLAGLQTRAERDGDEYVINGSKIWTSGAHKADWIFCLVRTDPDAPKHLGISLIMLEMDQPGVEVSPLELIDGTAEFCQVFFDGARARANQMVGELNGGWSVAKRLLQYERSTDIHDVIIGEAKETILALMQREVGMENGVLADPTLRERLAAHEIDARALDLTMRRAADEAKAGQQRRDVSSVGKYRWGDMMKEEHDLAMVAAGTNSLGWEGSGFLPTQLQWTREWLFTRSHSIWGGTHEIQKNLIAKRVLDIPE
ncbi:MAG: acyl-CoA dehydrogenase family protein [Parvularculales bacterium]